MDPNTVAAIETAVEERGIAPGSAESGAILVNDDGSVVVSFVGADGQSLGVTTVPPQDEE